MVRGGDLSPFEAGLCLSGVSWLPSGVGGLRKLELRGGWTQAGVLEWELETQTLKKRGKSGVIDQNQPDVAVVFVED